MDGSRYLFSERHIRQLFEKMLTYARAQVEGMEEDAILSCDLEATAKEIVDYYRFEFPKLDESAITTDTSVRRQSSGPTYYITTYFIPFSGEGELFKCQPITPPSSPPIGEISGHEIVVSFVELQPEADNIRRQFDQAVHTAKRYLAALETESTRLFGDLSAAVRALLVQRSAELERAGRVAKSLGYPLRRRGDAVAIAVPVRRKKVVPAIPAGAPRPVALEPYLEDAIYQEIVNVLASMSLLIERNPSTFGRIEEEALRDHFLLQLNGQFEGKAAGETFNAAGKTDILLREQDKNLFIAECKFWDGPKSLRDAIDQLFSYLTWRDSKAAILVFSRRKDFSRTLEEASKTLETHPQYRRTLPPGRETSFRALMARPDDEGRHIDLTVLLFNLPST